MSTLATFIAGMPKAELHLHIEGALEPELMIEIGRRNGVELPWPDAESARRAYDFRDLQSFLDIYYRATSVLIREEDFYDLTTAYLRKAASQHVRHAEVFFDPQTHTARGIAIETVIRGIEGALRDAHGNLNLSTKLIMCILRHLSEREGMEIFRQALPWRRSITGIGLDSAERNNPPSKFRNLFELARREGFMTVAHAGEEEGAASVREALDILQISRIDHGVRCMEDERLVAELVRRQIPLTVCPLSNIRLRVFPSMQAHNLKRMLQRGLCVSINSDDPAYFGGYVNENYIEAADALGFERSDIVQLARNSFIASSLDTIQKQLYLNELQRYDEETP
ncbi:MAG: adenosine deaminase [Chlorobiaceae bacterium]|nr:adenosine deaminase [Chlorobiaceae bacterium]